MRKIKYRGWNPKNEKWIYGYYLQNRGHHFVCEDGFAPKGNTWEDYEVVPESVGQFTGICESGSYQEGVADDEQFGKMVYEGDILIVNGDYQEPRVVVFYECMFGLATIEEYECLEMGAHPYLSDYRHLPTLGDYPMQGEVKVIGNVYNNPRMDLTTEDKDGKCRIIIIGEQEMQRCVAEYDHMFNGDAMTTNELREALMTTTPGSDRPDCYMGKNAEFGYSVSEQWPDRCHCFRTIYHGKHASVFKYWLGKA